MIITNALKTSEADFDPYAIAKSIGDVFRSSGLSHGGILFECGGRIAKIGTERYNIPNSLHEACDQLIVAGRHPALTAAKSRRTPFDILALEEDYRNDAIFRGFVDEARALGVKSIFAFPLHAYSGRLFVASGLRIGPGLTELELRLIHTYCLDALDSVEAAAGVVSLARLLTARERECLVAAARGQTEKGTARNLGISPSTVHAHLENCKRKLSARNKIESIVNALRRGEVRAEEL